MKYFKTIKKWAKLRNPDPKFADAALQLYNTLTQQEKALMLQELQDYIDGVKNGSIIPSPVKLPTIPTYDLSN